MRCFDNIEVGEVRESDTYEITREEIIEFGEKYDPQPFHTDEQAAADSIFGGLVASGWQIGAICMRLNVDISRDMASQAGIGVDNLRWHRPLYPGDELQLRTQVVDKRDSTSRDNRGYVTTYHEGHNQDGELVISYDGTAMVKRQQDG